MPRNPLRPPRTRGEHELRELIDILSINSIAHHTGVTKSVVASWAKGYAKPFGYARRVLAQLGIPPCWWHERAK